MPHSQSQQKKERKQSEAASSRKTKVADEGNDSVVEKRSDACTPSTPSKLPETQATITQMFRDVQEADKHDSRTDENRDSRLRSREEKKEERNIESILQSLEKKMNKMVTVDHLEKEFKKLITEEFLTAKIDSLKQQLKSYFDKELEKVYTKIQSLEERATTADERVERLECRIHDLEADLESVKNTSKRLEDKGKENAEEIGQVKYAIKTREIQMNDLEQYTRANNIRIYGLDDRNRDENVEETTLVVIQFLKNKLDIDLKETDIDIAHRLGKFSDDANRPVICRFVSRMNKQKVMKNRRLLKGSVFVIKEDLTRKNAKLLQDTSEVENVEAAWSDQGKIIALLISENDSDKKQKVVVTLRTDLSLPITLEKITPNRRYIRR